MAKYENAIHTEIKSCIARKGWTLTSVVKKMNEGRPLNQQTTVQNMSNKLTRGTIKYCEVLEIARIIGFEIQWK